MTIRKGPWILLGLLLVTLTTLGCVLALHVQHVTVTTTVPRPAAAVVRVHWRSSDLVDATTPGQVCFSDARRGRLCASYAIGEKPADALTSSLAQRGLRLVPR